ncbi:hypothetical protein ABTF44_20680, partial [Acinetobacter baumannii]
RLSDRIEDLYFTFIVQIQIMIRIINGLVILGITSLILSSCSNNAPKEARLIPKTDIAVASVNAFTLKEKLEKNGITIDTLLDKIFEKDSSG